ncbi:hypothetical protein ACJJTC_017528 [Scirpophaga incertulas]
MFLINVLLIWLHIFSVDMMSYNQQITELKWSGKCTINRHLLNDCNWCRCINKNQYICDARECTEVDMFGHFNDAIHEKSLGMEGHGSWRTRPTTCEPNVQYRRRELLCVCSEDGQWPNPVCRDIFQVLHPIIPTYNSEVAIRNCEAGKLYLVGCNACLCSSSGKINPKLCTKNKCSKNDPVLQINSETVDNNPTIEEADEIYAECKPKINYKLGCKNCVCLKNNRLLCTNCVNDEESKVRLDSFCKYVKPGQLFSRDCNMCYCNKNNDVFCSTKKCLASEEISDNMKMSTDLVEIEDEFEEENCSPYLTYKRDCNVCFCVDRGGRKVFACTLNKCGSTNSLDYWRLHNDCVKGTSYKFNCLICTCNVVYGIKTQICEVNPICSNKSLDESKTEDLRSVFFCEPSKIYREDCNTCTCLSDSKTMKCTSYICDEKPSKSHSVEIYPFRQKGNSCRKGLSYKVDCNYCFCLNNGNAICTTLHCNKSE